jgi:hypothetical protein
MPESVEVALEFTEQRPLAASIPGERAVPRLDLNWTFSTEAAPPASAPRPVPAAGGRPLRLAAAGLVVVGAVGALLLMPRGGTGGPDAAGGQARSPVGGPPTATSRPDAADRSAAGAVAASGAVAPRSAGRPETAAARPAAGAPAVRPASKAAAGARTAEPTARAAGSDGKAEGVERANPGPQQSRTTTADLPVVEREHLEVPTTASTAFIVAPPSPAPEAAPGDRAGADPGQASGAAPDAPDASSPPSSGAPASAPASGSIGPPVAAPGPVADGPDPGGRSDVPAGPGLTPAAIQAALAAQRAAFGACVDAAVNEEGGQALAGRRIGLLLQVDSNGTVKSAGAEDPDLRGSRLEACLVQAASRLSFRPFEGAPVGVRIPLVLGTARPPAAAPGP